MTNAHAAKLETTSVHGVQYIQRIIQTINNVEKTFKYKTQEKNDTLANDNTQ